MASPKYSLNPYGLQVGGTTDINIRMNADARFNCQVGFATDADLFFIANENINGTQTASLGYYEKLTGSEALGCTANAHTGINVKSDMQASLEPDIHWSKIIINGVLTDDFVVALVDNAFEEELEVNAAGVAIVSFTESLSEVLGGHMSTSVLTQQIFIANVTIPPGGRLIIDSNLFTMTMNNQNAIHLQKGDWITLDRKTVYLDVSSSTGGRLNGSIIYQGRYL